MLYIDISYTYNNGNVISLLVQWKWNESGFRPPLCTYRLNWARRTSWGWMRWHCPPDTVFESRALAVWGRARYLSVTEAPHNTEFHMWMGKKHFVSFKPPRPGTELRTLAWKAAVLTTTLGPLLYSFNDVIKTISYYFGLFRNNLLRDKCK